MFQETMTMFHLNTVLEINSYHFKNSGIRSEHKGNKNPNILNNNNNNNNRNI